MSGVYTNLAKKRVAQSTEPPLQSSAPPLLEKPSLHDAQKKAADAEAASMVSVKTPVKPPALPVQPATSEAKEFDLNIPTEKSETFAFSFEELLALAELKTGLSRVLGVDARVTKIDIIRCAVHMIVADYRTHGEQSFIVQQFKKKKPVERARRKIIR
jgi:hypothetical protein